MSQKRIDIGAKLREILGSTNVYFQPPESIKLKYPCVIYSLDGVNHRHANDKVYKSNPRYVVTFITKDPDNTYYDSMIEQFMHCRFDRRYVADNLYHDVYTIY